MVLLHTERPKKLLDLLMISTVS